MNKKGLDKLWSDKVKEIGYCKRCGAIWELEAHHIFGRFNKSTRWDLMNGICLCRICHENAHENPIEFKKWHRDQIGGDAFDALQRKSREVAKNIDYREIEETLKGK